MHKSCEVPFETAPGSGALFAILHGNAGADVITLSFPLKCELGVTCFAQNISIIRYPPTAETIGVGPVDGHDRTDLRLLDTHMQLTGVEALVRTVNLNPDIVVMESAEDGERFDASGPLNLASNRRIFV